MQTDGLRMLSELQVCPVCQWGGATGLSLQQHRRPLLPLSLCVRAVCLELQLRCVLLALQEGHVHPGMHRPGLENDDEDS